MRHYDLTTLEGIEAYVDDLYAQAPDLSASAAADRLSDEMVSQLNEVTGRRLLLVDRDPGDETEEPETHRGETHEYQCKSCGHRHRRWSRIGRAHEWFETEADRG